MSPLSFSVVTAVRNARKTIEETLASVAAQTYAAKEHIVQDGRSTDGTLDLLTSVSSEIVRLESVPDAGAYDAFNRGLRRASGNIITFLGADDRYEDDLVLERVAAAFSDPHVEMVYGDALVVRREDPQRVVRYYDSGRFAGLGSLRSGFMPAHTALFVRRALYERIGEYDTSYRITGDFEWLVRAFRDTPPAFTHIAAPLVRMRAGGLSSSGAISAWRVTQEFHRACRTNGATSSYLRLLWRLPRKAIEFAGIR